MCICICMFICVCIIHITINSVTFAYKHMHTNNTLPVSEIMLYDYRTPLGWGQAAAPHARSNILVDGC